MRGGLEATTFNDGFLHLRIEGYERLYTVPPGRADFARIRRSLRDRESTVVQLLVSPESHNIWALEFPMEGKTVLSLQRATQGAQKSKPFMIGIGIAFLVGAVAFVRTAAQGGIKE